MRDASDEYALLAVQGPTAIAALGLPDAPAFTHAMGEVHGVEVMVCRTGYTGEAGVELMCVAEDAVELWDAIIANGTTPCGLGARDTLRLEVCYPLHGNDITVDTDAISAGLGWTCALEKEFSGVAELRRIKEEGPARRLAAFVMDEKAVPRQGMPIVGGWRGHLGNALADARRRHRDGIRPERVGGAGHGARDRRPRQAEAGARRQETDLCEVHLTT